MTTPASSSKKTAPAKKVGRKKVASPRKFVRRSISLPPDTAKKVEVLAKKQRRNVSNMIEALIVEGLDRLQPPAVVNGN